jgi:hypothetical protein
VRFKLILIGREVTEMNKDELFINIGAYERGVVRPIYLFLHILNSEEFDMASITGLYDVLIEERLVKYSGSVCIVVTLHETKHQISIINHSESTQLDFSAIDVQRLYVQCMNLKRSLSYMLVIGKGKEGGFYTKTISSMDTSQFCPESDELEEFSNIVYLCTNVPFPVNK